MHYVRTMKFPAQSQHKHNIRMTDGVHHTYTITHQAMVRQTVYKAAAVVPHTLLLSAGPRGSCT